MSGPPGWPVNSLLSTLTRTGRYWKLGGENQQFTPNRGPWRVTPLSWSFMEWKCSERHRNHDNLQVWYTGNYAIASPLSRKKEWFRELFRIGPSLGYHPNPEKSFVIMYYENIYIYIYIYMGSGTRCPLFYHSLVCRNNPTFLGIDPLFE